MGTTPPSIERTNERHPSKPQTVVIVAADTPLAQTELATETELATQAAKAKEPPKSQVNAIYPVRSHSKLATLSSSPRSPSRPSVY